MSYIDTYFPKATTTDAPGISYFDFFCVLALVLYAATGNRFFESASFTENPIGVALPIILSGILALRWNIRFDKNFYLLLLGFTIYFVAITMKDGVLHPSFLITYYLKFFVVYAFIKALGTNLFKIYEHILYYLAIIGLAMWGIQTILRGDTLFYILSKIPGITTFSNVTGEGLNIIFYSVQPTTYSIIDFIIPRNSGYTQEPGCFAVYLCLAMFINLFITNEDKNSKKRFVVLVMALVSSMSTTGYVIFMLIMIFYILGKDLSKVLLLFPVAIVALIYISTLPFMSNKIVGVVNEKNTLDQMILSTVGQDYESTPQRFTSFLITFVDFKANPILGLGPENDKSWVNNIGARIAPISGIGNLLAQFGIVGFLFFFISSLSSSFFFARYFNFNGKFLLFFIIFFISISYSIILYPLLMCFWMFQLFPPPRVKQEKAIEPELDTVNY